MENRIVDARGQLCPKPLILTRKALKESDEGFSVLIDNRTSWENVSRFLTDNEIPYSSAEEGGEYRLSVSPAGGQAVEYPDAAAWCPVPAPESGYVISFARDRMGEGPEELGRILIQGFCNTIREMQPLPRAMVFYNSGIMLARDGSPVLESLKELEAGGVKILVCGTCSDYFDIKSQIRVGTISNMYDIMETLTGAGRIVSP